MSAERIAKLLEDIRFLDPARFELVQALREMILGLGAGMPFCGVFSYAKHVSLEFVAGASLPVRFQVLEGAGKFRRHIKLASPGDITRKHVREYLGLALGAAAKS